MRGFWLSVVMWILFAMALMAAFFAYFHYRHQMPMLGSLRAGAAGGTMVFIALYLAMGAARAFGDRLALRRGLAGEVPLDGRKVALVGKLEPLGKERVCSPLDGSYCLAYQYWVTGVVGSGRRQRDVAYYRGTAIAPSEVATSTGTYRLLAVPDFDGAASLVFPAEARDRFRKYLEQTAFRSHKDFRAELDRWADADGSHRSDVFFLGESQSDGIAEIEGAQFHQHKVLPGDSVCVIGHHAAGRGIVPPAGGARMTRILAGDPQQVARTFSTQIRNYLVMASLFAAAAAWLAVLVVPG